MTNTLSRFMLTHLLAPVRATLGIVALLTFTACSCDDEPEKKPQEAATTPPLEQVGVPSSIKAELYPLVGTTSARPVVMTLAEEPHYCEQTRRTLGKLAHVICSIPSSDGSAVAEAEARLREALVFLKKSYPRYLTKSPVIFVAGPSYQETAWRMLLAEPGFFAHSYLAGPNSPELTNTLMAALHGKGAKTLVIEGNLSASARLVSQAAGRAGLRVESVRSGPTSLESALKILTQADKRLVEPASAGQTNSASSTKH